MACTIFLGFIDGSMEPPAKETWVQKINLLEKEMGTNSSILVWEISWTEKPGRLLSMGFSRQEYWNGLPFPSSGVLPHPGIKPGSPALEADALTSEPPGKPVIPWQ